MTYYFPYSWEGKFSVILLLQKRFYTHGSRVQERQWIETMIG